MILAINGSTNHPSANERLLKAIIKRFSAFHIIQGPDLGALPLFVARQDHSPYPPSVMQWKEAVSSSAAVIITTPAYLENIPAALKSAFEWLTTSGELAGKPVLAITYSPSAPRGEKAMQSLLWSLQALEARIIAQLSLFQDELTVDVERCLSGNDGIDLIREALFLLSSPM